MAARLTATALILALALPCSPIAARSAEAPPLELEATIPLDNVAGRIDHMAVDLKRGRLLVAELGNDSVDVIGLTAGRVIHRISGLKEPQGVGYSPAADLILVSNAGDGSVVFFRADDFAWAGRTALSGDADNLRVDRRTGHVVVGYGAGGLAVIDPRTRWKVADNWLSAHPEGFQLAPDGSRAYVNIPEAAVVATAYLSRYRRVSVWSVPRLRSNFPMAIDARGRTIAIVFRKPPTLGLLDTESGAVLGQIETCGDADDLFFDERRQRIYVSCGTGAVDVFERYHAMMHRLARIETSPGARTSLFVPELDRLFVASRAGRPGGAARILVFRPLP